MMIKGKTILIFLPDGDPRSVRIAEFTSRTVQAVLIPRAQLNFACSRPELQNVGLYFLTGEADSSNTPLLYIGETEECVPRLKQHNKSLDWWTTAIVCISKTSAFTKAHVKYLEWHSHQEALAAGRYKLIQTIPTKSHVPEPVIADLMDHFDTIKILTSTLGFHFFEQIMKPVTDDILICKGKKALANGQYSVEGMIVFADSLANDTESKSMHPYLSSIRQQLLQQGILITAGNETLRFTKDQVFPSPSQAAGVVLGRNANGWVEWRYKNGRTLDQVKRKESS
jgi:hypothetical protein